MVAKFSEGVVLNIIGEPMGRFENQNLIVNDQIIGRCIGVDGASAAAIALIFQKAATRGD